MVVGHHALTEGMKRKEGDQANYLQLVLSTVAQTYELDRHAPRISPDFRVCARATCNATEQDIHVRPGK
jgi:hypothetical protein